MSLTNKKVELSVILPVFNEEKNIPIIVRKYKEFLKKSNIELIFVEDSGSEDETRKVILNEKKKNDFIIPVFTKEKGYGISIYNGLRKSRGKYICWTHSDLQTDPADTIKALKIIQSKKNQRRVYVKGKRYSRPILDRFFTFGMSVFESLYLKKPFYDINAQPNLFHKSFLDELKNPPHDFSFDLFIYYVAKKNGMEIVRFPVYFGKRIYGKSAWNDGFKARIKFIKRTIKFSKELKKSL